MNTAEMTCRCCAKLFIYPLEKPLFECPGCGTMHARPQAKGLSLDALNRATRQRNKCDFTNAENSYQHVLRDYPEEHEALWGLALCKYGVEYVEDPVTGKRLPTVHSVRKKPMQLDGDFQQAYELAPPEVRVQYECDAAYIDDAMAKIRKMAETCPHFDVFICHKTTKPGSEEYTEDYNRAFKLYHMLDKMGFCVFFAPAVMEGISAGADYEASIYHALDTAKVMLVVCSNEDYLESPWVHSEWQRFFEMADESREKYLLPLLYDGMSTVQLPKEFKVRRLQTIKMGELNAADNVRDAVQRWIGKHECQVQLDQEAVASSGTAVKKRRSIEIKPIIMAMMGILFLLLAIPLSLKVIRKDNDDNEKTRNSLPRDSHFELIEEDVNIDASITPTPTVVYVRTRMYAGDYYIQTSTNGTCEIVGYYGDNEENLVIPAELSGYRVTGIGEDVGQYHTELLSVSIPNGVITIGKNAFTKCTSLVHVDIPNSVTSIGSFAFQNCDSLRSIALPGSLESVGSWAFSYCDSLTDVSIEYGIKNIWYAAFYDCDSLEQVNLPQSVVSISACAFNYCDELKQIDIPTTVTKIENGAFEKCPHLSILCSSNSTAYQYAQKKSISYTIK